MPEHPATPTRPVIVLLTDVDRGPLLCAPLAGGPVQVFERRGRVRTAPLTGRPVRGARRGLLAVAFLEQGSAEHYIVLRGKPLDGDETALADMARDLRAEVVSSAEVSREQFRWGPVRGWQLYGREDRGRDAFLLLIDPELSAISEDVTGAMADYDAKVAERRRRQTEHRAQAADRVRVSERLAHWHRSQGLPTSETSGTNLVHVDASVLDALLDAAHATDPDALSDEQRELAAFGRELLARAARFRGEPEADRLRQSALEGGAVLVVESLRGGGRVFVAPDRTVLFVGSALGSQEALDVFRSGARTPIESFGPEGS